MKLPYNTPMVDGLKPDDQFYVAQDGTRKMAKVAHVATVVAAEVAASSGPQVEALSKAIDAEARNRAQADEAGSHALHAEADARAAGDQANAGAIAAEATARSDAITAEAQARAAADKVNADSLTDEAKARVDADKAQQARIVSLTGTLSLAAGLSLAVGKTERKVAVAGLKKGDVLSITPDKALPGGMSLGDAYCLSDGELTLATLFTSLLGISLSAATTITLSIKALR